ncbi:hypothetical protein Gpo141_00009980 [Globisporangium polare]
MSASEDFSHADEGVEEEMMFKFDEQDTASEGGEARFTSLAAFETNSTTNRRVTFGISPAAAASIAELRPPNPVAALLQSRELDDDEDSDDDELREFCPMPMRSFSAPPPRLAITPPAPEGFLFTCGRADPLDFNDRRKRKSMDDTAIGSCRVRPLAKRAKSFSFGRDSTVLKMDYPTMFGSPAVAGSSRSESISIPRPASLRAALGSRSRSRSGSTGAGDSLSSHSHSSSSPSWNATASSLEYFCRRSLDVSSPLRVRFRDLMVGSVGRATSYTGP